MNGSVTSKVPLKNHSPNKSLNQSKIKSSKTIKDQRQSTLGILKISSNESRFQENNQHLRNKRKSLNESQESDILNQEIQLGTEENEKEMFGDTELDFNQSKAEEKKPWIIHHDGKFRMRWDLYVIILTLWNCLYIPFNVAFEEEQPEGSTDKIAYFDYFVDFCFFCDIVFNFRTTYVNSKT